MGNIKDKKLFLLDMDGTIYLDNEIFDGTTDFLNYVKASGRRYMFLTNNSSKSVDKYIEKLSRMGIKADEDDFLTSVDVTAEYLKKKYYKKIYVLGTKSFFEQLKNEGLNVTNYVENDVDCLCMGFDTELTFQKLEDACVLLGREIDYIATNPDWVCPVSYGFVPDCGSVAQMLYNATKRYPVFMGKPEPDMVYSAIKKSGFSLDDAVLIGDRLYTDIACGVNAGISTVFVLSGEGTLDDLETSDANPEFIYENIRMLYNDLIK